MTSLKGRPKLLEKFSASAIQALNAAREEALRLEFNQVDTDHLLLGLVHEQRGLANTTLQRHGVTSRQLRLAAERLSGRGYSLARQEDLVFAPDTIRVLARVADPQARLVESADLFLALLREGDTAAQHLLTDLALDPTAVAEEVKTRLGALRDELEQGGEAGAVVLPRHFVPRLLTEPGRRVFDAAFAATRVWGHNLVGTEQLLVALLSVSEGLAAKVLAHHGVQPRLVEAVAARAIGRGSGTIPGRLMLSRWCEEACDMAWTVARKQGLQQVGSGHLLLGLLELDVGGALYILDQLDLNLPQIRDDIEASLMAHPGQAEPADCAPADFMPLDEDALPEDDVPPENLENP